MVEFLRLSVSASRVAFVFFFKQKTAYEMRISGWSSDVCSSDLVEIGLESVIAGIGRDRIAVGPAVIEKVAVFALRRAGARGEIFVDIGQRAEQPLLFYTPQDES